MDRRLVSVTMVAAPIALAIAALAAGYSAVAPAWWSAAVHLAVLGGITLMIYAVNIRIVPVFARRTWRSMRLLEAQIVAGAVGAWITFVGIGMRSDALTGAGQVLALAGGLLFMANLMMLFRQPPAFRHVPPTADPKQEAVDKIATKFTRLSGPFLVLGLALGVALTWWRPASGRWDLVWAHMMLIGFFVSMASGVCYHVLARWTNRPWRSLAAIRWHYRLVVLGLPFMLLALATNTNWLFLIAGPLQALALALLLINIVPLVVHLERPVRAGILTAGLFLVFGVTLGVAFAIDPGLGPRLRQVHALSNLFGWGGLLISGFGYYFVPHFAGAGVRWPRLAHLQLGVLVLGVVAGVVTLMWRALGDGPAGAVVIAQGVVGLGLLLFAIQTAGIFFGPRQEEVVFIRPTMRTVPFR